MYASSLKNFDKDTFRREVFAYVNPTHTIRNFFETVKEKEERSKNQIFFVLMSRDVDMLYIEVPGTFKLNDVFNLIILPNSYHKICTTDGCRRNLLKIALRHIPVAILLMIKMFPALFRITCHIGPSIHVVNKQMIFSNFQILNKIEYLLLFFLR